jgi:hypothetical protein
MTRLVGILFALGLGLVVSACGGAPSADSLRDAFAQQLAANKFLSEFQRSGDNMTFTAPGPDGSPSKWRVQIESATVAPQSDARQPFKGTVTSSWFVNGNQVRITGRDSNLPIELTSNGLGQECWAFWEKDTKHWSW